MNLPNLLTVTRMVLSPVFMIFFLIDNIYARYVAFVVFVVASLTDAYDGWLARRTGIVTSFGRFMDPLADKLLTSTALISLLVLRTPFMIGWMVVVIVAREIGITGLRAVAAYRGVLIPSTIGAKWKTVMQMVFVNVALLHLLVGMTSEKFGTPVFLLGEERMNTVLEGLLTLTMVLTLATGLRYILANRELVRRLLR
ncbi:MAG: CDP-diacylglycerol--glycerol-3-phosphate 3-phosphatidyltransferase [Candidatus Latescibacterota bacterium]|nr:MAG: CDP-diacylglycerol--glycerol-3-phosphate 3-phosphatidyltransferase [Candidatus Latescibacterota bacterium]